MPSGFSWPADDSTAGALLCIASTVVLTVWMRRKEFRQGGRPAGVATLDLLSSIRLAIPALAYSACRACSASSSTMRASCCAIRV